MDYWGGGVRLGRGYGKGGWGGNSFTAGRPQGSTFSTGVLYAGNEREGPELKYQQDTRFHIGDITRTLVSRWCLEAAQRVWVDRGEAAGRVSYISQSDWTCFLFFLRGYFLPLSFKQRVWLSSPRLGVSEQQLVFICSNRLEEFTDCETDVFRHFYPPQWLSLHNSSLCGFRLCIHSRGSGCHTAVRSTKQVISMNRAGAPGCLLLWCDLLVSARPWMALCARAGTSGEGLGTATKGRLLWIQGGRWGSASNGCLGIL